LHHIESSEYSPWLCAITATALIGIAPIIFLFFVPVDASSLQSGPGRGLLNVLLSFAVGGLLGDVFLHLLPHSRPHDDGHSHSHSHDEGGHDHSADTIMGLWVLGGITTFFLIEKLVRSQATGHGHSHSHSHAHGDSEKDKDSDKGKKDKDSDKEKKKKAKKDTNISAYLNLAADFSHNFTDGLAVAASFMASYKIGLITTATILFHELPHEIGDFAILIQSGYTKRQAIVAQVFTAIGALVGTLVGLLAGNIASSTLWILPFTAGGFIYVACVTVLPVLLETPSTVWQTTKEVLALGVGVGMMVLIGIMESH